MDLERKREGEAELTTKKQQGWMREGREKETKERKKRKEKEEESGGKTLKETKIKKALVQGLSSCCTRDRCLSHRL